MKSVVVYLFLFTFIAFEGCETEKMLLYSIENNSNVDIALRRAMFPMEPRCMKPEIKSEYDLFVRVSVVKPNSKNVYHKAWFYPDDTLYIHAFERRDVDEMDCEEFVRVYPVKKSWVISRQKMDSLDWKLEYP